MKGEEPLLELVIDERNLPGPEKMHEAFVMLIERHERRNRFLATRKIARRLMERYAERYFPALDLSHDLRRRFHYLLRERQSYRAQKYLRQRAADQSLR